MFLAVQPLRMYSKPLRHARMAIAMHGARRWKALGNALSAAECREAVELTQGSEAAGFAATDFAVTRKWPAAFLTAPPLPAATGAGR